MKIKSLMRISAFILAYAFQAVTLTTTGNFLTMAPELSSPDCN